MWIHIGGGVMINSNAVEAIWYDNCQYHTYFYTLGMTSSLLLNQTPSCYMVLGDVTTIVRQAFESGVQWLDLGSRPPEEAPEARVES